MNKWISKRKAILGIAFSFLGILATLFRFPGNSFFQSIVDIFAGGRSTSKAIVFFIFLALLYGIFLLQKNRKIFVVRKPDLKKILLWMIGILGVLGFCMFVFFTKQNNLPLDRCIATFNNSEISSTCISHNHVAKGAIGIGLKALGINSFESVDAGHAFLELIPSIYFIIYLLLLIVTVSIVIFIFIQEDFELKNRLLYIPLYGALTFGTIEHIFDGGLGDPRTIVLYTLLGLFFYKVNGKYTKIFLYGAFVVSLFLYFLYVGYGLMADADSKKRIILSLLAYISIFVVPLLFLFRKIQVKKINILYILIILGILPFLTQIQSVASYRKISFDQDIGYIALYKKEPLLKEIDVVGDLSLYEIDQRAGNTIGSVVDSYEVLDNILPVSVFWKTCIPSGKPAGYSFTLYSKENMPKKSFSSKKTYLSVTPKIDTHSNTYTGILYTDPCVPRILNILEESIQELGVTTFFITDIKTKNDDTI